MDLLDRYLNTIRWNLPRGAKADDIIAELHDVIGARIEEREERLGRTLTDEELSGLLRDFGHPLLVAARYGPQHSLIGPDLFPFYWFALKIVLAICAVVIVINGASHVVFGGEPLARGLMHGLGNVWWSLLANAGLVTLIFAVIERTGWLTDYLRQWEPRELPDLPDLKIKPQSAWESLFEIAVGIGFILWWSGLVPVQLPWTNVKDLTLTADPVWTTLWAPILALASARLVCSVVQWLRPRWKTVRAVLSVGTAIGGVALAGTLYTAGHWVTAASTRIPPDKLAEIDRSTNMGIRWTILIVALVWVFQCAKELWRLYMVRPR